MDALDKALKCKELFHLFERERVASAAAPDIMNDIADDRFRVLRQQLLEAPDRIVLSDNLCELLYMLCCAKYKCERLTQALRVIEANERIRLHGHYFGKTAMSISAGIGTHGLSIIPELAGVEYYECPKAVVSQARDDFAYSLIKSGLTPLDCEPRAENQNKIVTWETWAINLNGARTYNDILRRAVDGFVEEVDETVGDVDGATLVAKWAALGAAALSLLQLARKGWRAFVRGRGGDEPFPAPGKPSRVQPPQGRWQRDTAHMSERAADYQGKITGRRGEKYTVNDRDFDGISPSGDELLEAKGPGYEWMVEKQTGAFRPGVNAVDQFLDQARGQLRAAPDAKITWHFADKRVADAARALFRENGIVGIDIKYTPP
jgi:hypothetical protein